MKKWKIHFVPHTHWDKEWYFTKDASNVFLVDNFEKMKEICESKNSFSHQIYDSQLSVIDDYLSVFPEDESKINNLIKSKKLIVGPWYTQPDMFSTSGESLLRNLSYGKYFAQERGFSAKEAYTPDSFGFNSNLPQIIKHNECNAIIQWRGVDSEHLKNSVFNIWEGIDGTQVYLYNLFKFGYGLTFWAFNSVYKKWDKNNMRDLAKEYLDKFINGERDDLNLLKKMNNNTSNILCFPFGSDQSPIIEWLPLFVKELNDLDEEHEWILSDYDSTIEDLKTNIDPKKIAKISGELKYGQYSRTHRTIGSSRFDIKSLNKKAEYLLYNVSEPLGLIYQKFTGKYPDKIYQRALKFLLESHAHDSLGGSCTDKVNGEVVKRIESAIDMLESQNTLIKRRIIDYLSLEKNDLILFNLLPFKRNMKIKLSIVSISKDFKIMDSDSEVDFSIIKSNYYDRQNFIINYDSHLSEQNSEKGFYVTDIELSANSIDGLFFKVLKVIDDDEKPNRNWNISISKNNFISNENFKVELKDKNFIISDLKNKKEFILEFEYDQDAGDTYDFSPKILGDKFNLNEIKDTIIQKHNNIDVLNIKCNAKIPLSLESQETVIQDIDIRVILSKTNLNFEIKLKNKVNDIRLRALIKTNSTADFTYADQALSIVERPSYENERLSKWQDEKWKDMPVAIENFNTFVYIKEDENYKIGFYSNKQNEYEIFENKLALTLFRGVSFIGRRDLLFRPGRASGINDFPYETPESNLNKNLFFSFGIILKDITPLEIQTDFTGNDYFQNQRISDYFWIGQTFWKPIVNPIDKNIKPDNLFLETNNNLVVSAIKKRYMNKDIICRIANISNKEIDLGILINANDFEVLETNGLEKIEKKLNNVLRANELKTLIFKKR